MRVSMLRSRWAAIGAATAVALGAGGLGIAGAASPPANPVTTLISPCRLMDTRAGAANVGPRATPIGSGETYTATVRGTNGHCVIPANATGIVANVTIVAPSASSYLTVWPADKVQPTASSLNWVGGQAPTANQVTTGLSGADGKIKVFNQSGTVNVIVDITGYLVPADLSNYYTKAQVDATVSALQATVTSLQANTYSKVQVDAAVATAAACKGIARQAVNWHGCALGGANLPNAYLGGADLTAVSAIDIVLSGATLVNANLTSAELGGAKLDGVDAVNTDFSSAHLFGVDLTGADLTFADLSGANLDTANLSGALLGNVIWSNTTCPDGTNSDNDGGTCVGHL